MIWVIPAAVLAATAAKKIYDALNESAWDERNNWENNYRKVERSIQWHKENIKEHINEAEDSCDYKLLVDLHYSSLKVGDEAYKLLNDSRASLDAISESLQNAKSQISHYYNERKESKDKSEKERFTLEINGLKEMRKSLFPDKDELKEQRNHFYEEVRSLNIQTSNLKFAIRDKTGWRGVEWFERYEERKRNR